ncbi:metallophosphoesterase [Clostridium sp. SHJSY1]|uniref:metallophosphoesterase family protein n=1 Tax=Clostridium sp. SHJSY1 TaxID=2942483 RepID=UPI0028763C9D|nr:metallophosphoesterase [Clostridium sp. SHJSY1]MDS0527722.1 metallophosphoesterase [Clostridium sp. SHJSY1]
MKKNKILSKLLITTTTIIGLMIGVSISASAKTRLYTFDVISDTHVKSGDTNANTRTATALKCIKNNFDDKCIVINGDVVDDYYQYDTLQSIISNANSGSEKLPYIYFNFGNHEFRPSASHSSEVEWYDWSVNEFSKKTNAIQSFLSHDSDVTANSRSGSYDWQYVKNNIFFFLGTDKLEYDEQNDCADLNRDYQLSHLDDKLNNSGWKFVFCHQPPHGTIHGADWQNCICERAYNDYNGDYFEGLLSKHTNTIMFTSHMHNNFNTYNFYDNSDSNFHQLGGTSIFGTSSIMEASQGLHVKVYDSEVVVQGVQYTSDNDYNVIAEKTIKLS